jgi:hypothetical protein
LGEIEPTSEKFLAEHPSEQLEVMGVIPVCPEHVTHVLAFERGPQVIG